MDVEAPGTQPIELQTVSGNVHVNTLALQVAVESVSGDERVLSTGASHLRLHTVSGEIQLVAAVASGGSIEAETISGDVKIDLAGPLAGSYDLRTLSGDISNCFGPKAVRPQYGPGARASFRDGDGTGHVSVESKSGDVHLCNQAAAPPGPHVVNARPEERTPSNRT